MQEKKYIHGLIAKSLIGDLKPSEKAELSDWLKQSQANQDQYNYLLNKWNEGKLAAGWERIDLKRNWNEILSKASPTKTRTFSLAMFTRYAAAAAVLIFCTFWLLNQQSDTIIHNTGKKFQVYQLPDRSNVWLKSGASIAFDQKEFTDDRSLSLSGEAFFEVEKDPVPFIVSANGSSIEVLGTSFNVHSSEHRTQVLLLEGSVKFSSQTNSETLTPGESASFNGKLVSKEIRPADLNSIGWKTGVFRFSEIPLHEVIGQVQEYYGVEAIISEDKKELLLTTVFDQLTIGELMDELTFILDVEVQLSGNTLTIE